MTPAEIDATARELLAALEREPGFPLAVVTAWVRRLVEPLEAGLLGVADERDAAQRDAASRAEALEWINDMAGGRTR
jgi:hypothetical protein